MAVVKLSQMRIPVVVHVKWTSQDIPGLLSKEEFHRHFAQIAINDDCISVFTEHPSLGRARAPFWSVKRNEGE